MSNHSATRKMQTGWRLIGALSSIRLYAGRDHLAFEVNV